MNLKWKLLLPAGASGLLAAAYLAWGWFPDGMLQLGRTAWPLSALATAAAVMLVTGIALDRWVRKPLAQLAPLVREAARSHDIAVDAPVGDEFATLEQEIEALRRAADDGQRDAREAVQRCKETETALRLSEERYALALRASGDGLWEWNLRSGEMQLSPRWKSMLGFADSELNGSRSAWRERIHPADLAAVEAALEAHLAGASTHYEQQFRMLHKDGSVRWILSRGTAIRHASGKPYRMVGLDTDITRVRRIETILGEITEGTAGAYGNEFFRKLVCHFARALQVPCAFITECADYPTTRLRTLAFWSDGNYVDDFEYDLPGTPCETVVKDGQTCFYRKGVADLFPVEAGYEGYLGIPIFASDKRVIGHLVFLDTREMGDDMLIDSVYRIFTARAAAEMERLMALNLLHQQTSAASLEAN